MNSTRLLSIIVTFYNNEKYVKQCLDSIISQLHNNMELIIIDDGSKDKSISFIKDCITGISNAYFFSINNSGISFARNFGIKKAVGKYIMFIDGDDYIIDNALAKINNYINKKSFDLLTFKIIKFYEEQKYFEKEIPSIRNDNNLTTEDLINNKICGRPWRFIYSKKLIKSNKLFFPERLVYEDEEWVPKVICYAQDIKFLNEYVYVYRKRKGSITTIKDIKNIKDLMIIVERTYKWSLSSNGKIDYIYFSLSRCIRNILSSLLYLKSKKEKAIILNWYRNNKCIVINILKYNVKLKYSICFFGPYFGIKLYKKIFREKNLLKIDKVYHLI